jgi:hypothetical protein
MKKKEEEARPSAPDTEDPNSVLPAATAGKRNNPNVAGAPAMASHHGAPAILLLSAWVVSPQPSTAPAADLDPRPAPPFSRHSRRPRRLSIFCPP